MTVNYRIMKRSIYLLIVCIFFTNCKHQISRIGYNVDTKSSTYENCNITIKKFEIIPDSVAIKIGTIKLSDSGFSNNCSEEDAIVILKKEGCALNADFINISKETNPDMESNCYRCRAEFYKFKD
jgi:hypothetical protein